MKAPSPLPPTAFSYVRFSTAAQAKGDSLRRQTEAAAVWCKANKVTLDASTTLHDLGKSAYTGGHKVNQDRHALAAFLKLVESGKVPRGSYLIIENLDRLSREHIQPALLLALNLLQAGIRIVQLKPAVMVFDSKSDTLPVMMMMMELSRGHSESAIKSERVGHAWAEKKKAARNGQPQPAKRENRVSGMAVMTHKLPAWVEERGGKLVLIPKRAEAVKRIFQLAAAGYGGGSIVKRLNEEKVQPIGRSGKWLRSYIALILNDRRPLGEYQPRDARQKPDGESIAGYFPAVVTPDEWYAARGSIEQRGKIPGRIGAHVNVFAGLLKDACDGGSFSRLPPDKKRKQAVLINHNGREGTAPCRSFPLDTFERAVLSRLKEIDPHSILNGDSKPDESLVLAGDVARVEAKIAELQAELMNGDVAALATVLRQLEARKVELCAALAVAKQKAAHPLSEAWGECQSLLKTLDKAPDPVDARLRLRSVLRRMVQSIQLLIVPRGPDRLAAVQIWFKHKERRRDYLILHRAARGNGKTPRKEGSWSVRSITLAEMNQACIAAPLLRVSAAGNLLSNDDEGGTVIQGDDLRYTFNAELMAKSLANVPLDSLFPPAKAPAPKGKPKKAK